MPSSFFPNGNRPPTACLSPFQGIGHFLFGGGSVHQAQIVENGHIEKIRILKNHSEQGTVLPERQFARMKG